MLGFLSAHPQHRSDCLCVNRREHTARVAQRFSFQGIWDLHTIAVPLCCVCPVMLPVRPCSPSPLPAASFPAPHAFSSSLLWYYPVGPDLLALHCHGWETGGLGVIWQEGLSLWCALLEREALKFQLAQANWLVVINTEREHFELRVFLDTQQRRRKRTEHSRKKLNGAPCGELPSKHPWITPLLFCGTCLGSSEWKLSFVLAPCNLHMWMSVPS